MGHQQRAASVVARYGPVVDERVLGGWGGILLLKTKRLAQNPHGPGVKNTHHSVHRLLRLVDEVGAVSDRTPAAPNKCAALGRPAHRLRVGARDRTPKNSRSGLLTAVASAKVNHVFFMV